MELVFFFFFIVLKLRFRRHCWVIIPVSKVDMIQKNFNSPVLTSVPSLPMVGVM